MKTQPTFIRMKSKQQRIEQLLHEKIIREQSLDLSVEFEGEFLEKWVKKDLKNSAIFA